MGLQLSCESKFRRELKFSIECDSVNKILSMLRASCPTLAPIFYKRSINNIYFDQDEYDFIKAEEANCDDSTLPDLPANDSSTSYICYLDNSQCVRK